MVSKNKIIKSISEAEKDFHECWDILASMKGHGNLSNRGKNIVNFQSILATALFKLEQSYQAICQERKQYIRREKQFSKTWFQKRINQLDGYKSSINEAITIGKSLGDAFVWIFYQDNEELLEQHNKHEMIPHMSIGIGGRGELEFIKNIPIMNENIVIYHGITSFLRLGDISLVNPKTNKVTAIGEIKTQKNDNHLSITIHGVGENKTITQILEKITISTPTPINTLPAPILETMKKQVEQIRTSFMNTGTTPEPQSKMISGHYDDLKKLGKNLKCSKAICQKCGEGLLLIALKNRKQSLASKLLNYSNNNYNEKLSKLEDEAVSVINIEKPEYNRIILGALHYKKQPYLLLGMTPLFWWPIDIEFLKQIIFQDVIIARIYNPAYFYHKLEKQGFQIKLPTKENNLEIVKNISNKYIKIEGIAHFLEMIQEYLISEDSIINLIHAGIEKDDELNLKGNTKINLRIRQKFT